MKKLFIAFLVLIAAFVGAVYIFIPKKIEISNTAYINVAPSAAYRYVSEESKWSQWWPATPSTHKISYTISHKSTNAIEIIIRHYSNQFNSNILVMPLQIGSTALFWKGVIETGNNPLRKIKYYQQAQSIRRNMNDIFKSLRTFLEKNENIYGIPIRQTTVTDTLLVTTKLTTIHYPSTKEVYDLIQALQQYISQQSGKEMNYPMLNVAKTAGNSFETMVAIPVNKELTGNKNFSFKRMVPGNILVAELKGGMHNIKKASNELETYIKDYQLIPVAIPFESLVTNRMNEPDTAKWITRLYYPIL